MKYIDLIILFFIYSFIGWLAEVSEGVINRRDLVNRGFLIGPYCPIYGFGGLAITFFLKKYENDFIVLFVMGSLICSILEYFASLILEKIFNTRWWDYRDKKIHLNGRVCIEVMILFGIASLLFMKVVNPIIYKALLMPNKLKITLAIFMVIFFVTDIIITVKVLIDMKKENMIEDEDITKKLNKRVKEIMSEKGYFTKRLLNAFPLLKSKTRR